MSWAFHKSNQQNTWFFQTSRCLHSNFKMQKPAVNITTWFHDPSSNSYPRDSPLLHPIVTKVSGFFRPRLKVCPLHTVLGFSSYQNAPLGFKMLTCSYCISSHSPTPLPPVSSSSKLPSPEEMSRSQITDSALMKKMLVASCVCFLSKCHDHPMSEIRFSRANLPETNISHLKTDGWNNTVVSFWDGLCSEAMLVSGSVMILNSIAHRVHLWYTLLDLP